MQKLKFVELAISEKMQRAISDMGFEEASPIQTLAIPHILDGHDLIGRAQTGTGKTAAFAIPIIEKVSPRNKGVEALVLCPTRELVIQVTAEFQKLIKYRDDVLVTPVYGGQEIDRQFRALKKNPQIIVGTPGRLMDHIRRGSVKLDHLKFAILDEADEMLDMGFRDDIEIILKDTPENKQTIMFSATMPGEIVKLMKKYQKEPIIADVTEQKINVPKIEQYYCDVNETSKAEALARLLDMNNINLALVFCNTKNKVDTLVELLKTRGYFADGLHGDMSQRQRDKVMTGFRSGTIDILVATDVAGRGIDVSNIDAVFNYDLPGDDEDYVHRIGRTGRAGKEGKAFTFITGRQGYALKRIEKSCGMKIARMPIPTIEDLDTSRITSLKDTITDMMGKENLEKYSKMLEAIMGDDYTAFDIAATLLKMHIDAQNTGFDSTMKFYDSADLGYLRNDRKPYENRRSGGNYRDRDRNRGYSKGNNEGGYERKEYSKDGNDSKNRFKYKRTPVTETYFSSKPNKDKKSYK